MTEYINPPGLPADPDEIAESAFDAIRDSFPNYEPHDGQLATIFVAAIALRQAQYNDLAQMIPVSIFRYYGANVVGLPPNSGTPAAASITIYVTTTQGWTIPADTEFVFSDTITGDEFLFFLPADVTVTAGQTNAAATVYARDEGTTANGLVNATVTLVDPIDFITQVTHQGTTAGGIEEEDDDDYLDRLAKRVSLSARPVWSSDFATLIMVEFPQVHRALFIDNFIPPSTFNAERAVAGLIIDEDGADLWPTLGTTVEAFLETQREWGFIVNILPAEYTTVDATFSFTVASGFDSSDVISRSEVALSDYVSPALWGVPPGDAHGFERKPVVYLWEIVTVLNNVPGIERLTSLTLGKNGGSQSAEDLTLNGAIPLPTPGAITGSSA